MYYAPCMRVEYKQKSQQIQTLPWYIHLHDEIRLPPHVRSHIKTINLSFCIEKRTMRSPLSDFTHVHTYHNPDPKYHPQMSSAINIQIIATENLELEGTLEKELNNIMMRLESNH